MSGLTIAEAVRAVLAALERGEGAATVTVVSDERPGAVAGSRVVHTSAGVQVGTLGDLDDAARLLSGRVLEGGTAILETVETAGGAVTLFAEAVQPQPRLIVVGAGHIAVPLAAIGVMLGFRVTVLDDREEMATPARFAPDVEVVRMDFEDPFRSVGIDGRTYVVLVTRAHKYDYDSLLRLLEMPVQPGYIGMIGSRRRVRATFDALQAAGYDAARLRAVHAPVGVDIGAETPAEIAVSIAGELIRMRSGGGSAATLGEKERVLERLSRPRAVVTLPETPTTNTGE